MTKGSDVTFVHDLVRVAPELKPLYEQHLADNDTLLPHVLMADVARFAIAGIASIQNRPAVIKLLDRLENGLSTGDEDTRQLILASFVESLIGETTGLLLLRPLMGPNLKRAVTTMSGK